MPVIDPTLDVELALLEHHPVVIGIDEVGRGAIAGPVAVGACAIDRRAALAGAPEGLRDSKALTPRRREAVAPLVREWARAGAVGLCSAAEIDESGIVACLAAAAKRALAALHEAGVDVAAAAVLLDGSHDWLTPALAHPLAVTVRPKADRDCAAVAGASVLAKVDRDGRMRAAHESGEYGDYAWSTNMGYGSAAHFAALGRLGPCGWHRRTWLRGGRDAAHPAVGAPGPTA